MAGITVEEERERRQDLWVDLEAHSLVARARADDLRQRRIYGGAQGIWVDKDRTGQIAGNGGGITVGVLHTGRHYPDDLSEDGVIYHYPKTKRGGARDTAEIEATKSAGRFELPIFVILPGPTHDTRSVRFGWVTDWDDNSNHFLILFGQQKPVYEPPASEAAPFTLFSVESAKRASVRVRPGQQRFRFQVLKEYGAKCAVCSISHSLLLHAAHLCGKAAKGSDDWRNGLPLCATHHLAFDADLFAIDPDTLEIVLADGLDRDTLGVQRTFATIKARPHLDALRWRFEQFNKGMSLEQSYENADASAPLPHSKEDKPQ
jgi:putative restriction endonuclease